MLLNPVLLAIGFTVLLILVLAYAIGLFAAIRLSLYPPRLPHYLTPESFGEAAARREWTVDGLRIKGWEMTPENPIGTVVMAHGYVMNRCQLALEAIDLKRAGWRVILFDFPSHGVSDRARVTFGWREADYLTAIVEAERAPFGPTIVFGSSMGAAAIAYALAAGLRVDGAILDSCYDRFGNVTVTWWRWLLGKALAPLLAPATLFMRLSIGVHPDQLSPLDRIRALPTHPPALFLHGERDRLANTKGARKMQEAWPGSVIHWSPNCAHCEGQIWDQPGYRNAIHAFLSQFGTRNALQPVE